MSKVLPILFNTEMVRAILDDRKTTTRRLVKGDIILRSNMEHKVTFLPHKPKKERGREIKSIKYFTLDSFIEYEAPYKPGDILYVRETWNFVYDAGEDDQTIEGTGRYIYYADNSMPFSHWVDNDTGEHKYKMPWHPSIHMPKEAARIWLRVTDVRVERLKEIMKDPPGPNNQVIKEGCRYGCDFIAVWENTIKKSERDLYGWDANPLVWVIEFERCEKP